MLALRTDGTFRSLLKSLQSAVSKTRSNFPGDRRVADLAAIRGKGKTEKTCNDRKKLSVPFAATVSASHNFAPITRAAPRVFRSAVRVASHYDFTLAAAKLTRNLTGCMTTVATLPHWLLRRMLLHSAYVSFRERTCIKTPYVGAFVTSYGCKPLVVGWRTLNTITDLGREAASASSEACIKV